MKIVPVMLAFTTLLAFTVVRPPPGSSQNVEPIECQDGNVLTGSHADVLVNGTSCTLDGATVYGSVLVDGGTVTTTANGASILAGVKVTSGGDITLTAVSVLGAISLEQSGSLVVDGNSTVAGISIKESGDLTIGTFASSGEVLVEKSGDVDVNGSVASILSKESGGVRLTDARVFPGGVTMALSSGALEICGTEIGVNSDTQTDGSGGVYVLESGDVLAVADESCGPSEIEGAVIVKKGTGDVRFAGATLNSDLIVSEQVGHVEVDGSGCDPLDPPCATVSDVLVQKSTGDITLRSVTTDSDTTIKDNDGNVTVDSSTLGSDVRIQFNGWVELTNNSFSLEDVLISGNEGPVLMDRNCDMRLSITENSDVMITNNNAEAAAAAGAVCTSGFGFTDADITKNTGGVLFENNTGEGLFCSDNDPAPVQGSTGNVITFSDGQCAGF